VKNLRLNDIIKVADEAYYSGEELISRAAEGHDPGDGLAKFIAQELKETFDSQALVTDQISQAMILMDRARQELQGVHQAFSEVLVQVKKVQTTPRKNLPLLIGTLTHPIAQKYLEERLKGG